MFFRRLLTIDPSEIHVETRGIRPSSDAAQRRIETIGRSFLAGYHAILAHDGAPIPIDRLDSIAPDDRGFAYEGAAMAAWLLDALSFRGGRWDALWRAAGTTHPYVLHVGIGWALARLPWLRFRPEGCLSRLDPRLRWLVVDGFGFHEGFFHSRRWIRTQRSSPRMSAYARRVFDQGLGRSLWFITGMNVDEIPRTMDAFDEARRGDLWSGVGLACAYAGEPTSSDVQHLMADAGCFAADFQQGVAFGAEARVRAGIANDSTHRTCLAACGVDAHAAAELTRTALTLAEQEDIATVPPYERWRQRTKYLLSLGVRQCER